MKYLRYGCLSIAKNMLFTFLMMIEIIVLIISANVMVASANSREMLKKPFENIISHNGYYASVIESVWENTEQYYEFSGLFAKLRSSKIYIIEFNSALIVDDEIFFKYSMPLKSGSWPQNAKDDNGRPYVVVSPDLGKNPGDEIIITDDKKGIVSGVLTDITYTPAPNSVIKDVTSFYNNMNYNAIIDLYKEQEENFNEEELNGTGNSIIVAAKSGFYEDPDNEPVSSSCFIVYDDDISEADKKYNETIMEQIKNYNSDNEDFFIEHPPTFTELSTIRENTDMYISNIYNSMLPVILGVAAVVLIGLIGTISINTVTQLKNYGIYFLCGSKWSECLKISFANILIILIFSGGFSALLLYLSRLLNLDYLIGQTFAWNNLIISIAIILGMIILSLFIPFGIIRFTSPVEVIKSEK